MMMANRGRGLAKGHRNTGNFQRIRSGTARACCRLRIPRDDAVYRIRGQGAYDRQGLQAGPTGQP